MNNRLFISSQWLLPAHKAGGPAKSVHLLSQAMVSEGRHLSILTSGLDIDGESLKPSSLQESTQVIVKRTRSWFSILSFVWKQLKTAKVCYCNDLYSLRFHLLPALVALNFGIPVVLAPRGMLTMGALSIKTKKKMFYLHLLSSLGYFKRVSFHFTDKTEHREFLHLGIQIKEAYILPNFSSKGAFINQGSSDFVKLKFVSRLSEKKNLLGLLRALRKIQQPLTLDIYGTFEENRYKEDCLEAVNLLPDNVEVAFMGMYTGNDLPSIFSEPSIFILPTLNENYGHSIVEALSFGIPILISSKTPWTSIETTGGGALLNLESEELLARDIVQGYAKLTKDYSRSRESAYAFFNEAVSVPNLSKRYATELFQ